jgi:hypothetical protein
MAEPGAVVDAVGTDRHPHELLNQIVLLIGGPRRGDRRHPVGAAGGDGRAQAEGDVVEGLGPAHRLQAAVAA